MSTPAMLAGTPYSQHVVARPDSWLENPFSEAAVHVNADFTAEALPNDAFDVSPTLHRVALDPPRQPHLGTEATGTWLFL